MSGGKWKGPLPAEHGYGLVGGGGGTTPARAWERRGFAGRELIGLQGGDEFLERGAEGLCRG